MKKKLTHKIISIIIAVTYSSNIIHSSELSVGAEKTAENKKQPIRIDINSYATLSEYQTCSANNKTSSNLPIDLFSEEQKKLQLEEYLKAIQSSEATTSEYESNQKRLETGVDIAKFTIATGVMVGPILLAYITGGASVPVTYTLATYLGRSAATATMLYGLDKVKENWSDFYTKKINFSEQITAYLVYKQKHDEIDALYNDSKNNPKAKSETLQKLEFYVHEIIKDSAAPNPKTSATKRIESLNFKSRTLALSILELKSKLERNEITISQLEKQILKSNGSTISLEESLKIQNKVAEFEKTLLSSATSFKNFQEVQLQKINFISNQIKNVTSRIEEFKNKKDSSKRVTEEYSQLAQLKKELELSVLLSAGQDLNNKKFMDLLSDASNGNLDEGKLKSLKDEKELKESLNKLADAINIASELSNLAIQTNMMSKSTAIKVQGALKVASGIHQIAQAAAGVVAGSAATGGVLGAITIMSGLFSLFGPQKDNNNQLGDAFKAVFENQQKIMAEIHSLKDHTLRLHIQAQEYMHNEFNYVKENLYLIKSNTNYLVDKSIIGSCINLEQEIELRKKSDSKNINIENVNWNSYELCISNLFSIINKRENKYLLEDIKRTETKNVTSESRQNEEALSKTNNNLIYLLDFAKQKFSKSEHGDEFLLKKALSFMRFENYNYKILKTGLDEIKNNMDQIKPIDEEMLSFIKNAKINDKYLSELTHFTEILSKWAVGLRQSENSVYFLKNDEINNLINKIRSKEEKIEEIAPYILKVASITSHLKGIVDSAMIQRNLLDGHILLPFAWDIIQNDLLKTSYGKTNTQGNSFETLHTADFEKVKNTILKNPNFLVNTIRWGLYQGFNQLSDNEKERFLEEYSLFLRNQKSNLMRSLISKLMIPNGQNEPNLFNYEIQVFTQKEADLVFELQFYTQKLSEMSKKATKEKGPVTEDLREAEEKKICLNKIEKIKSIIRNKGKDQKTDNNPEINQNAALYLSFPGISDTIKLPTTDELTEGTFIQTNQNLIETQRRTTQLYLNYKTLEKM